MTRFTNETVLDESDVHYLSKSRCSAVRSEHRRDLNISEVAATFVWARLHYHLLVWN